MIERGKSRNNGYNSEQIAALGIEQTKGWFKRMCNMEVEASQYETFLSLTDAHFNESKVFRKKTIEKMFEPVKDLPWKEQYLHPNWQKMRLAVLNRDNFTCVDCHDRHKTLHVHHLKYLRGKMIWEVPIWYLVSLCEDCHSKEHDRDLTAKQKY